MIKSFKFVLILLLLGLSMTKFLKFQSADSDGDVVTHDNNHMDIEECVEAYFQGERFTDWYSSWWVRVEGSLENDKLDACARRDRDILAASAYLAEKFNKGQAEVRRAEGCMVKQLVAANDELKWFTLDQGLRRGLIHDLANYSDVNIHGCTSDTIPNAIQLAENWKTVYRTDENAVCIDWWVQELRNLQATISADVALYPNLDEMAYRGETVFLKMATQFTSLSYGVTWDCQRVEHLRMMIGGMIHSGQRSPYNHAHHTGWMRHHGHDHGPDQQHVNPRHHFPTGHSHFAHGSGHGNGFVDRLQFVPFVRDVIHNNANAAGDNAAGDNAAGTPPTFRRQNLQATPAEPVELCQPLTGLEPCPAAFQYQLYTLIRNHETAPHSLYSWTTPAKIAAMGWHEGMALGYLALACQGPHDETELTQMRQVYDKWRNQCIDPEHHNGACIQRFDTYMSELEKDAIDHESEGVSNPQLFEDDNAVALDWTTVGQQCELYRAY